MKWNKNIGKKPKGFVLVYIPGAPKDEQFQVKMYHYSMARGSWADCNLDYWVDDHQVSHWMELAKEPK